MSWYHVNLICGTVLPISELSTLAGKDPTHDDFYDVMKLIEARLPSYQYRYWYKSREHGFYLHATKWIHRYLGTPADTYVILGQVFSELDPAAFGISTPPRLELEPSQSQMSLERAERDEYYTLSSLERRAPWDSLQPVTTYPGLLKFPVNFIPSSQVLQQVQAVFDQLKISATPQVYTQVGKI